MTLSPPQVVKKRDEETGIHYEPWQDIQIEVENEHSSLVIERMSSRGADVKEMLTVGERQVLKFECSTASFMGMRSWLRDATGGGAVVVAEFKEMREAGEPPARIRNGVLIANNAGIATAVDLSRAGRQG